MRLHAKTLTVAEHDGPIPGITQPCRSLGNGVQHWLELRRRGADDLENLARGRLLLQRLLRLVEQEQVLDGYDGLIGKSLPEIDLRIGEWLVLAAVDCDRADETPIL